MSKELSDLSFHSPHHHRHESIKLIMNVQAELPADYSHSNDLEMLERHKLSRVEESMQESPNVPEEHNLSTQPPQVPQPSDHFKEDGPILGSKWSPSTTTPTTPHTNSSRPLTITSEPLPSEDQRPDLDEIIRAWSDAPHIGRSSSAHSSSKLSQRLFHKDYNPAEASLASTPGENVLGIYAIPKDAPPIPKIPETVDREPITRRNGADELQQALEYYVNADKGEAEVVSDAHQASSGAMNTEERKSRKSKSLGDEVVALDSEAHINERDTKLSINNDRTLGETCRMDEHSNTALSELDKVPTPPFNVIERVEASENTVMPAILDLKTSSEQDEGRDKISQTSNERTLPDGKESNNIRSTSHHHDAMVKAVPTVNNDSETSHYSRFSTIVPMPTDQKLVDSPLIDPRPPMDRSPVPVGVSRTRNNRNGPLESDFARKRSMFESPSEQKSSSSPFLRKALQEMRQSPGSTAVARGQDIAPASKSEARCEDTDRPETSSQPSEENHPAEKQVFLKESREISESHNDGVETETLGTIHDSQHTGTHSNLSGDAGKPSKDDLKYAEMHSSPGERDSLLSTDISDQHLSHIITSELEKPSEKAVWDQTQAGICSSTTENSILGNKLDKLVTNNPLIGPKDSVSKAKEDEGSPHQYAQMNPPPTPVDEHPKVDLPLAKNAGQSSDSIPAEEKRSSRVGDINDPYADLDPWGRASLNRFAAMLREEARVESNKDKLNIFNVFASRESRLRVVLYGTDDELILPQKPTGNLPADPQRAPSHKQRLQHMGRSSSSTRVNNRTNSTRLQQSAKELPPLPPNRNSVISPPISKLAALVADHDQTQASPETLACNPSESPQYSPGGRPIVQRLSRMSKEIDQKVDGSTRETSENGCQNAALQVATVEGASNSVTAASDKKAAYARPKFNEDGSEVKNYLTNRRSIYRPFATQTMESLENAISFGHEPPSKMEDPPVPSLVAPTSQYNSTLPTRDSADESTKESNKKPREPESEIPLDLRRFVDADFDPLVMVLPESEIILEDSAQLADLKNVMEAVPDEFSFIHASVVAWDANVKNQREENDRQRQARQTESEQRIDALFDDHEIGYSDIAELEGEFKQSEAVQKAEEDRSEYQTFVEDVFNLVWMRLHYELDQLIPHYEKYSKLMNETSAGKETFILGKDGLALAPTMTSFLGLHQKLEIRYQKAFEAVLERDRRLKKTEISPWYTLSNIVKVKQLEKQFEDAEKNAIIEYCQQRDKRANQLMDVLDQNTLRGVGSNQDYMEAIMNAVRRVASGRAFASIPGSDGPKEGIELVQKAKTITNLLASSSEQIVQTFHVADMLLNSADYEVSVAKAKVAKADVATLAKLKEERAKEDQKLMRDLEHRLALIREDSRRTNDEIIKLMLFLGVQNGRAINAQVVPPALGVQHAQSTAGARDAGHDLRLQKASEEAKGKECRA